MVSQEVGGPPLVVICGPTAVGKTAAAIALARRIGAEIIAADSRTIYRGIDIGTAKPTPAQRALVPHHLLDVAEPDEVITLAAYKKLSLAAVSDIRGRGHTPLLVGGTGLYIRAITEGLTIPEVEPDWDLRGRLETIEQEAVGTLHRRLSAVDPVAAARIHPHNVRRLVRALEVYERTGRPITVLQRKKDPVGKTVFVGLTLDRTELYRRIEERVDAQISAGLVDEARRLIEAGYARNLPAMQGLGYKEIIEYLDGKVTLNEATRTLKRNTRRYAKRQYTWFRRDDRIRWLDVGGNAPEEVADAIAAVLQ